MLEKLLKNQIRGDPEIAGMLAIYKGNPAFFYQKSPQDTDHGWQKPVFPRVDFNIDKQFDPERKTAGILSINVWCSAECVAMPEDIEKRLTALISGTFYTSQQQQETVCAIWSRSDAFQFESPAGIGSNTAPEVFGVTVSFDLMEFPQQITTDPDPVQGLNCWTKAHFPSVTIINHDVTAPVWKPADKTPAVYWRFEGVTVNDRQSYTVNWYTGQFAAHLIAGSVPERNRWIKAIVEQIQLEGEILLADGSPMFAKQIAIRHNADPLREGQIMLTGQYGVLAQHRKEYAHPPINRAVITEEPSQVPSLRLEVNAHGKKY